MRGDKGWLQPPLNRPGATRIASLPQPVNGPRAAPRAKLCRVRVPLHPPQLQADAPWAGTPPGRGCPPHTPPTSGETPGASSPWPVPGGHSVRPGWGPAPFPFSYPWHFFRFPPEPVALTEITSSGPHQGLLPSLEAPLFRTHHALPPEPTAGSPPPTARTRGGGSGLRRTPPGPWPRRPHRTRNAGADPRLSWGCPVLGGLTATRPPTGSGQRRPVRGPERISHRGRSAGPARARRCGARGRPGVASGLWGAVGVLLGPEPTEPPDQERDAGQPGCWHPGSGPPAPVSGQGGRSGADRGRRRASRAAWTRAGSPRQGASPPPAAEIREPRWFRQP